MDVLVIVVLVTLVVAVAVVALAVALVLDALLPAANTKEVEEVIIRVLTTALFLKERYKVSHKAKVPCIDYMVKRMRKNLLSQPEYSQYTSENYDTFSLPALNLECEDEDDLFFDKIGIHKGVEVELGYYTKNDGLTSAARSGHSRSKYNFSRTRKIKRSKLPKFRESIKDLY